jgi:hypothetical protein
MSVASLLNTHYTVPLMTEIDSDALLPNEHVKNAVRNGDITQLSRGAINKYASEGDTFSIDEDVFVISSVDERTLGDLTDLDAQREGSESLTAYRERMQRVHTDGFEWDPTNKILTYQFESA